MNAKQSILRGIIGGIVIFISITFMVSSFIKCTELTVVSQDGSEGRRLALPGVDGAYTYIWDKDGQSEVSLYIGEDGSGMVIRGGSIGYFVLDNDEFGNGGISTFDENGYRQK